MNTTPHYDLLPLMWWENPWTIAAISSAGLVVLVAMYLVWRMIRARKHRTLHPLDQLLFDVHSLQRNIKAQQCTIDQAYQELMRILREYSHATYAIYDISHTDEEFMDNLKRASPPVSETFLVIVSKIKEDVYQVKFANTLFPADYVQAYIHDLIVFFKQEKDQLSSKNT